MHLSRARGLNRKVAAAWWTLGAAQMDGLLDEAESNVKEALRITGLVKCSRNVSSNSHAGGKLGEVEQIHLRGIDLNPESPDRWESYACFLEDVGRQGEAQAAYKKARLCRGN